MMDVGGKDFKVVGILNTMKTLRECSFLSLLAVCRAGNKPSYSGSTRKKLGSGSTRLLNESSLSLNLGSINFESEPEPNRAYTLKNDFYYLLPNCLKPLTQNKN